MKWVLTADDKGHFFLNGKDVTSAWHLHFVGLTGEQESRCVPLFKRWYIRKYIKKSWK